MIELTLGQIAQWCGGKVTPGQENILIYGMKTDSRQISKGDLFVCIEGENTDGHLYAQSAVEAGAAAVLASAAVPTDAPAVMVDDTLRAYGQIAAGYRLLVGAKVVGITGSVGKTTTKEMTACVLESSFRVSKTEGNHNNNLGLPMTIMEMAADTQIGVFEMGMNHSGEMAYLTGIARPDIAVITNIGTMHIEHLGSREGILQAKLEILRGLPENGIGIFNGDEPLLWNVRDSGTHRKYYFGIENYACDVVASNIQEDDDGMHFLVTGFGHQFELFVPVMGRHTVYNALAAVTVGLYLGVRPEKMQANLGAFQNTGSRQKIYEKMGMTIIEDCYNAGPESTEAALNVLESIKTEGRRIAVLGDMLELGNRSSAEHYRIGRLTALKADMLFAYGAHSIRTVTGAITGGMPVKHALHFNTREELAHMLSSQAAEGDVLLFKGSRGMKMERALKLFLGEE